MSVRLALLIWFLIVIPGLAACIANLSQGLRTWRVVRDEDDSDLRDVTKSRIRRDALRVFGQTLFLLLGLSALPGPLTDRVETGSYLLLLFSVQYALDSELDRRTWRKLMRRAHVAPPPVC